MPTEPELLDNPVRPYAWGSTTEIPRLLGVEPTGKPQAELWLGAHPAAPSLLRAGGSLPSLIAADPVGQLSDRVLDRFGPRLPFLLKVIAADRPLSLQAHPDLTQARMGYADEESRGVPLESPERSYVDPNHKPELVCALTPFEALCGFRPIPATLELLGSLDTPVLGKYLDALRARPDRYGLREVVTGLLTVPADRRRRLVDAVVAALDPSVPEFATAAELGVLYPGDPGVIIALLLNRLRLEPGEAMFLAAGNMHCYLRGTAVEVMASSDNVLRGGFTAKHVDVPELLRIVDVTDGPPPVLVPSTAAPGQAVYEPPVPDFRLTAFSSGTFPLEAGNPRIALVTEGSALIGSLPLAQGASAWLPASVSVTATVSGRLMVAEPNLGA